MKDQPRRVIVQGTPEGIDQMKRMLARCVSAGTKVDASAGIEETLAMSDDIATDAIFMDVSRSGSYADEVRRIKERLPRVLIIAICDDTDRKGMRDRLAKGAHSVLSWGHFDEISVAGALAQAIARRDLEDVNKTLKVVNSILRHDVMNNLTVIGGGLEIYKLKKDEKFLNSSIGAVERSVDLIKKMKEVEQVVSPKELKPIRAREVIDPVVQRYSSKGVAFEIEGDATVVADDALTSVFDNLLNNAMVHSGSKVVRIKIQPGAEGEHEIRVADEGIGIPDDVKPKIWQEGYKHGKGGQSGLGLYIVKKVMERYGGTAEVQDNNPSGAVFILRFRAA
ncbi:MAG TPA: HAMP domain-containing sensor histidine kinase [Methanomassiliicoccales archaeon]|nr:HAMP domain-containing sensor histidine kinase [Methanomassiliicoccales archaeon]